MIPPDLIHLLLRYPFLKVFPIREGTKTPAVKEWNAKASNDWGVIKNWAETIPGCAWAVACGPSGVASLDVDVKNGKPGISSLEALRADPEWEERSALVFQTPSGGFQIVYRDETGLRNTVDGLGPGLDTRGAGGYFLCPGSPGYVSLVHGEMSPAPALLARRTAPVAREEAGADVTDLDAPSDVSRALTWLQSAPVAVEGEGGDLATFKTACRLKDMGLSEDTALEALLSSGWNARCIPPWDDDELARKVHNAYQYGVKPVGSESLAAAVGAFEDLEEEEESTKAFMDSIPHESWLSELEDRVARMNERFALITLGNKIRVTEEAKVEGGFKKINYILVNEFFWRFANKFIMVPKKTAGGSFLFNDDGTQRVERAQLAKLWMTHPDRRQYEGEDFMPPGAKIKRGYLNLFQGFAVKPLATAVEAAFSYYKELVEDVICQGVKAHSEYVWNWLADMIQRPGAGKPGVALVLHGDRGTGKGTFTSYLIEMLGPHGIQFNSPDYLTSQFNGHLADKLLLVADEAFWCRDTKVNGIIKGLVSEKNTVCQRKGLDTVIMKSFSRLIINTNEEAGVLFGRHERRYFPLQLSNARRQDKKFFTALHRQMASGGLRALFTWLSLRDLRGVNLFEIPKNEYHREQVLMGMREVTRWWFECLERGHINELSDEWESECTAEELYQSWKTYATRSGIRFNEHKDVVVKKIFGRTGACPIPKENKTRSAAGNAGIRVRMYTLPPLREARQKLEDHLGLPDEIAW